MVLFLLYIYLSKGLCKEAEATKEANKRKIPSNGPKYPGPLIGIEPLVMIYVVIL